MNPRLVDNRAALGPNFDRFLPEQQAMSFVAPQTPFLT
jgi:hypothetical protein